MASRASRPGLAALIVSALASPAAAASPEAEVRAAVAQAVAGINAHDPAKATALDTPDIVTMEAGRPNGVGAAADLAGFKAAFAASPSWRVRLISDVVDVTASGDFAVYRGAYHEDWVEGGKPMTHQVNFVAGWRRTGKGPWRMAWSMVAPIEGSHPR